MSKLGVTINYIVILKEVVTASDSDLQIDCLVTEHLLWRVVLCVQCLLFNFH